MSDSSRNFIIIGGGIIALLLIILLVVWIVSKNKDHFVKYETLETKMVEASKKYYAVHPKLLPGDGEETILNYDALVRENYIKPLSEMLKDGDKCSAHIEVSNTDSSYQYTPYLNCPGSYETKELSKVILQNNEVVTTGSGLYSDAKGGYYFRGEITNNYVKLGTTIIYNEKKDNIWRIISIESDGTILIRRNKRTSKSYVWDNRYNEEKKTNYGYNIFEVSRLKDSLLSLANDAEVLEKSYLSKLAKKKLCVGTRELTDRTKDGSAECSKMSEDEYYFGLLVPYQYMRISLDDNCVQTDSISCSNYNYLSGSSSEWSLTATTENNYKAYYSSGSSYALSTASNDRSLYVTAYLNNKVFYLSGTGTLSDPYLIK